MKFTVIGAGNTGQTIASHLFSMGCDVSLYGRNKTKTDILNKIGITLVNEINCYAKPFCTSDIKKAIEGSDYIVVSTTAEGHLDVAKLIKPYLCNNQKILIFNGNWGALEFHSLLSDIIDAKNITIAETGSMLYICKIIEPGKIYVKKIKKQIDAASIPSENVNILINELRNVFPQLRPLKTVLETSLNNSNNIIHTPISLFNASRIDSNCEFKFYAEGASPLSVKYIENMDLERLKICNALGINSTSILEIINSFWKDKHDILYDAIHKNPSYSIAVGPKTLEHRYITEDVPYGLVPISEFGRHLGIETPYIDGVINTFSLLMDKNFYQEGPVINYDEIIKNSRKLD